MSRLEKSSDDAGTSTCSIVPVLSSTRNLLVCVPFLSSFVLHASPPLLNVFVFLIGCYTLGRNIGGVGTFKGKDLGLEIKFLDSIFFAMPAMT